MPAPNEIDDKDEKQPKALDEGDIALLKTYVSLINPPNNDDTGCLYWVFDFTIGYWSIFKINQIYRGRN